MKSTRKLAFLSILVSLSVVLGIVDFYLAILAPIIFVPNSKIGLANIVILVAIYNFSFKDAAKIAILKTILLGFILGSFTTFIIGASGTILSFLAMYFCKSKCSKIFSIIGVSIIGGVIHVFGQIIAVALLYRTKEALLFVPSMIIVGVVTGFGIGLLGEMMNKYLKHTNILEEM